MADSSPRELHRFKCHLYRWEKEVEGWMRVGLGEVKLLEAAKDSYYVHFVQDGNLKTRALYTISNRLQVMRLSPHPQGKTLVHGCSDFSGTEVQQRLLAYRFETKELCDEFAQAYNKLWDSRPPASVSLKTLIDALIIEPGPDVLEFHYKSRDHEKSASFFLSLTPEGEITSLALDELAPLDDTEQKGGEGEPNFPTTPNAKPSRGLSAKPSPAAQRSPVKFENIPTPPTAAVKACFQAMKHSRDPGNGWELLQYKGKSLSEWRKEFLKRCPPSELPDIARLAIQDEDLRPTAAKKLFKDDDEDKTPPPPSPSPSPSP